MSERAIADIASLDDIAFPKALEKLKPEMTQAQVGLGTVAPGRCGLGWHTVRKIRRGIGQHQRCPDRIGTASSASTQHPAPSTQQSAVSSRSIRCGIFLISIRVQIWTLKYFQHSASQSDSQTTATPRDINPMHHPSRYRGVVSLSRGPFLTDGHKKPAIKAGFCFCW